MRNLKISVDKLVGKVSINLLHHAKSAACVISIIIDVPAVAYAHSYRTWQNIGGIKFDKCTYAYQTFGGNKLVNNLALHSRYSKGKFWLG